MTNYILLTLACLLLLAGVLVFGLWRHKRSGMGRVELLGAAGVVQSDLDPEGAVLINGELWSARSLDGTSIAAKNRVRVAQVAGHLLLVKRYSQVGTS